MATAYVDRVATRASTIRPARVVLTILAAPFYLIGLIGAVLWLVISWALAAVQVGFGDVRRGEREV
jgi:hypothetical protein